MPVFSNVCNHFRFKIISFQLLLRFMRSDFRLYFVSVFLKHFRFRFRYRNYLFQFQFPLTNISLLQIAWLRVLLVLYLVRESVCIIDCISE